MENKNLYNNGLEIIETGSDVRYLNNIHISTFDELVDLVKSDYADNGYFIAYLDYKVIIGMFDDGFLIAGSNIAFEPRFIQKLRIFNTDKELFIWRTGAGLKGRLRTDDENGTGAEAVDAHQVLFGTKAEVLDQTTTLTEDRGTEIILPFEVSNVDSGKNRVKIKTRNYIGLNELGQAGYIDCRFLDFTFGIDNLKCGDNNGK